MQTVNVYVVMGMGEMCLGSYVYIIVLCVHILYLYAAVGLLKWSFTSKEHITNEIRFNRFIDRI